MSVRLRLTLIYSLILALTLVTSGGVLYLTVAQLAENVLKDALINEAKLISNSDEFKVDRIVLPRSPFASPDTFVQTRNLSGQVVDRTSNLGDVELPLPDNTNGENLLDNDGDVYTATIAGKPVLIYMKTISDHREPIGFLQVARSTEEMDQTLSTLQRTLIAGILAVTVAAFGIGWLLAGIALRPINRMTQTAQTIGDQRDFSRRVQYSGPPDELGRLATTINTMLTKLEAAFRQEERALVAQRRFVADASHELRTPLTTVRGNIELLLREPPISDEDRVAVVTDIIAETERLIRLVNDLLLLERGDVGTVLSTESVAVREVIEEVGRQFQRLDPDREIDIAAIDDVQVQANRDAFTQILYILLDNAVKFSPPDGSIRVRTTATRDRLRVHVTDSGPGIPPELLPNIFERFYRGDEARSGNGAGLGLAIAKVLAEAQGGQITVESQSGDGATFSVSLLRGL
mgnify:CR=1 FL=1